MAEPEQKKRVPRWKHFVLPMSLSLMLGLLFIAAVHGLNVPKPARADILPIDLAGAHSQAPDPAAPVQTPDPAAPVQAPDPAAPGTTSQAGPAAAITPDARTQLAQLGGFMGYRGYSMLAIAISVALALVSLLSLILFVTDRVTRNVVIWVFAAQLAAALTGTIVGGTAVGTIMDRMRCSAATDPPPWDFCSLKIGETTLQLGYNRWVETVCTVAAVAVIFAILIVASSRKRRSWPAMLASPERVVTVLMVGAALLLTIRIQTGKAFMHWAFADLLAVERPPPALTSYINGASTFNGALDTALLGGTWFLALLLLNRTARSSAAAEKAGEGEKSFSVYNLSAIFAPVLTALASNVLGG